MNARTVTLFGSLALHAALAGAAWWYAGTHKQRKAHSVAVMGDRNKKKDEPKKPEDKPKPPPPKPKPATKTEPQPAPQPVPQPTPEPKPAPKSTAPPPSAGDFSNSGDSAGPPPAGSGSGGGGGSGAGAGTGAGSGGGGGGGKPPPVKQGPPKSAASEEDACTEAPTKPSPINRTTEIEYTQKARAEGVEGRLVLKVIIGPDGAVSDVIVVNSVEPSLDAAAVAAVKTWTFKPALRCGKPMAGGIYMLAQRFELGD